MIPLVEALCGSVSAFNYIVEELARREVGASQRQSQPVVAIAKLLWRDVVATIRKSHTESDE